MLNNSGVAWVAIATLLIFGNSSVPAQQTGKDHKQKADATAVVAPSAKGAASGSRSTSAKGNNGSTAVGQNDNSGSGAPRKGSSKPNGNDGSSGGPTTQGGDKGGGQSNSSRCRSVRLGSAGDSSTVTGLDGVGGVSVKAAGAHEVILCGPDENGDVLETAIQGLTGRASYQNGHETHYVRLFYYRKASDIAAAINNSGGLETPVKALGDDLLLFTSENEADDHAVHELKRWIALIDVPRPEVSLTAWSIQLSSKDWHTIQRESTAVGAMVAGFNQELHDALYRGWRYLADRGKKEELDQEFADYLRRRYVRTDYDLPCYTRLSLTVKICEQDGQSGNSTDSTYVYHSNEDCLEIVGKPCPKPEIVPGCKGQYCLGYTRIFSPLQPSLTSMLITLLAAKDSKGTVTKFVDCMENRGECDAPFRSLIDQSAGYVRSYGSEDQKKAKAGTPGFQFDKSIYSRTPLSDCEERDASFYGDAITNLQSGVQDRLHPAFSCFREQLMESVGMEESKALLRSALADFLFHYKASEIYPQDFVAWNRGASAQRLDNFFNPLIVAFNRDLGVYLKVLNDAVTRSRTSDSKAEFTSEGQIMVRVLSGSPASVDTTTQNFFPVPPIFSVRDFLDAAKGGSPSGGNSGGAGGNSNSTQNKSSTTGSGSNSGDQSSNSGGGGSAAPTILSSNLTPVAAQSLLALAQSVQSKTAQIGRDLNLQITANTLSGASSAELDVQLTSQEHDAPRLLDENSNANNNDNIDRVATHNVSTKVRVDSLKLFDISGFSATLSRGRSVPLIFPFIDIPYVGSLLRLRLPPGTTYHRSFAIISAVIVPTAADIANAIEFHSDLEASRLPKAEWNEVPASDDKKGKAKSGGTATINVQVDQPTDLNNPITAQIGCCACPKCPAPEPPEKPAPPKPHPGYYWIVTYYREGISVSQPYKAMGKSDDANPKQIQLVWEAAGNATSFGIYWSSDTDSVPPKEACRISNNLHQKSYTFEEITKCDTRPQAPLPEETVIYSPLPNQPGNLLEFHNRELECIEQEAMERKCKGKDKPMLSTMPVTRFGSGH